VVFPQNKIIAISSMVRIWGGLTVVGNGATIKRKDYTAIYPGSMVSVWDGAHVSGLIIDGNYWADDYGNPENYADNGVILGSNVVFDNNEVKNVRAYSIEVYGDSNVVITNNKIHDSYQYGIDTGGGVGGESYNITVTGNTIYNCQQVGIKIRGTHGAVIRNNTITMPENSQFARGISLYSFDLPNDDILIDGNTITGSFKGGNMDGISSDDSHNTKIRITNNIVSKCDVGIDLHFTGGTVTGNKISECSTSIAGAGGNVVANTILTSGNPPNSEQTPVVTPTATSPVIKPPTSSITVTAPNGGETWKQGTSNTITWSYTGSPGSTVKIELLKGSTPVGAIAESVPIGSGGKGTYSWPISSTGTTGSDYKVSVQSTSQPSISDMSNNYFTVTAGTAISTTTTPSTTPTPGSTTNTIVISGSSALYLDQFGIKGDGTDETAKLQSAFNYARDHSIRTVVFPQNKVITITSMVRIWGGTTVVGNGSTLKRKAYASMYPGSMLSVWDGARVSGLIIDGNYWTDDYGNPETYSDNGVILGDNVVFDNNEVKNVRAYSVQVYGDSNVVITNNKIHDSYQYGITTGGGVGGESHNITVTGNTIYNCQQVGIKIRGTHGAVIRNNKITMAENSQFGRGISLYSYDLPNDDILIDGNTITGSFKGGNMDGISSDNSQNTKIRITNNIVSKCDIGIDLHFTGGTITGNKISECSTSIAGATGNIVTNNI
jgi:parallel beta-helix repeat protein